MKINLIYDCVYPFSKGGAEKRIATYAKALNDAGHDVHIVSMNWWKGQDVQKEYAPHISVSQKLPLYKKNGERNVVSSVIFGMAIFWHVLKRKDVDVLDIEIFPYFPVIFARWALFITRRQSTIVGYWSEYLGEQYWRTHFGRVWRVGVMLEYLSFISCDRIVANSFFTQKKLLKKFHNKNKSIDMLPPASIDLHLISIIPEQEKIYDIIYYGRIIWHKHVEHIVDVVEALVENGYDARVRIIGDGPDAAKISTLIAEKKLQKNFVCSDFVDAYEELIAQIKSARIMVQPSEREGFGITVAEANACGLPVFVVDYPDNAAKDLIENDRNGFVCSDPGDLQTRIAEFFTDEKVTEHLLHLSRSSIAMSQKFDARMIDRSVQKMYAR